MAWAIDLDLQRVKEPPARHLLLLLTNCADDTGDSIFPSVERLARQSGYSERAVRKHIKGLRDVGVLMIGNSAIAAAKIKRADRRPTCYRVEIRGAPRAPRNPVSNL